MDCGLTYIRNVSVFVVSPNPMGDQSTFGGTFNFDGSRTSEFFKHGVDSGGLAF
jgi:hypothetical protein